jgi:spore germination protein YaaH
VRSVRQPAELAGGWLRDRLSSRPAVACLAGLGGILVALLFSLSPAAFRPQAAGSVHLQPRLLRPALPVEPAPVGGEAAPPPPVLPVAASAPLPAPPALADATALRPHELFGFAPYWELPVAADFDVKDLTTLAYFSLDVSADGMLEQQGGGWTGYQSQALANLISSAHRVGTRVVLTATCFDQTTLDHLVNDPVAADRLAAQLAAAIEAKNMDGVNLDFEGQGNPDRQGYVALVQTVAGQLHAIDPHWQVTVDTYASSAAGSNGFFDVPALAAATDGIFIMAYDMMEPGLASAVSPVDGPDWSVRKALASYVAAVDPAKLILGLPFYGYDWPVSSVGPDVPTDGPPVAVSYAQAAALPGQRYWDPAAQTEYVAYRSGGQWYEAYYDDPLSLSIKARLADSYRLRGLGIWALGMDGNDPQMMAALLGQAPPVKLPPTAPIEPTPSASPTPSPSPTITSTPSPSPTVSPTPAAPSPSPTLSPTPTPTPTPSASPTPSPSPTATSTPSPSPSPSPTLSPTPAPSPSPSPSPTPTPAPSELPSSSVSPTLSSSPTPIPSPTAGD